MSPSKLKILCIAPHYDKNVPGESWSTYKWVEGLSRCCEVSVLTTHAEGWNQNHSPTDAKEVIEWPDVTLPGRFARINFEMSPGYLVFYYRTRKWIKHRLRNGWDFDLVHQISPLALRYPSPVAGLGIPFVIGPLAGSLSTPIGFAAEGTDKQWFRKLRYLDKFRLRFDPFLRRTYADAELVLGVAPYVQDFLAPCGLKRFEIMSETGVDSVTKIRTSAYVDREPFKLLFVGRIIRTKGVIDAIRAVALGSKRHRLQFDIIGDGDHLAACRDEVLRLGLEKHVHFHGWLPRTELENWYQSADVFLFPSFREPSGNVIFESMKHGLPVITSTLGGPGYVIDDSCGIRVLPITPEAYSKSLGEAITELASNPRRLAEMSEAAVARLERVALWKPKIRRMLALYEEIVRSARDSIEP